MLVAVAKCLLQQHIIISSIVGGTNINGFCPGGYANSSGGAGRYIDTGPNSSSSSSSGEVMPHHTTPASPVPAAVRKTGGMSNPAHGTVEQA